MPKLPNLAGMLKRGASLRAHPPRLTHLRTRLTVLYAGLFVAILFVILSAVYAAVARNAERIVRDELAASGQVFERIWTLRARELESRANVLASDFGFRAAVATADAATIQSALDNLPARLGIDAAFVVGLDGRVLTASSRSRAGPGDAVLPAVAGQDAASGVFVMAGAPYAAVAAPILTPMLSGWVVFAVRLDQAEMKALEQLSAIPLQPVVLVRGADGGWKANTWAVSTAELAAVSAFLDAPRSQRQARVTRIGDSVAVIQPLAAIAQDRVVLLLRYPLAQALEPYNWLLGAMLLLAMAGVGVISLGSWALARNLTGPLQALRDAAERLGRGEAVRVEAARTDEIGSLERSFNAMAQGIADREGALKHATESAEAANRAKSDVLSRMSREIRTPLSGILGMAQIMAHEPADAAHGQRLAVIRESGEALLKILNGILDVSKADPAAAALADLEPEDEAAPLRVLAAEDNKTNQLILASLLEPFGIDLTLAENGREAVELFAAGGFDLVLMDIQMPEMTGVEATLAIRQGEAERGVAATPIVAVTANVMSEHVAQYLAAGMSGVVAKPIEAAKLFAAIETALDGAAQAAAEPAAQAA